MSRWQSLLQKLRSVSILVFGDCLLDIYHHGRFSRESPEQPGLRIFDTQSVQYSPGGAAHVALQCAALGAPTHLFGLSGLQYSGKSVLQCLYNHIHDLNVPLSVHLHVSYDNKWKTPAKIRYFDGNVCLFRADWEREGSLPVPPISDLDVSDMRKKLRSLFFSHRYGVIAIADYNKATVHPHLYAECVQSGVPILVDPQGTDFQKYKPCFLIKPNRLEATRATGRDIFYAVQEIHRSLDTKVVVTDGDQGAICADRQGDPFRVPVCPVHPAHVIGAGDSALAGLACAIGAGLPLREATEFAMAVASQSVQKPGTSVVMADTMQSCPLS